jgi:hypothetical protein
VNPNDSELLNKIGWILRLKGNIGESLYYFDQSIQKNTKASI